MKDNERKRVIWIPLRYFFLGFLIFLSQFETALADFINPEATILSPDEKKINLSSFSYFQTGEYLTLEKVVSSKNDFKWTHKKGHIMNIGASLGSIWFHFTLKNKSAHSLERILYLNSVFLERLEVAFVRDGRIFARYKTGTYEPRSSRQIDHRHYLFPVTLLPNDEVEIYLVESSLFPRFFIQIWDKIAFQEYDQYHLLFWGWFIGLMTVMALYNFFIFLSLRDSAYFFYVGYVLSSMLHQLCLSGFIYQIFGDFRWWKPVLPVVQGFTIIFVMCFFAIFLRLKRTDKWIFIPYWTLFAVEVTCVVVCLINYRVGLTMLISTFAILIPFAFFAFTLKLKQGVKEVYYIFLGWSGILTFTMLVILDRLHLLPIDLPNLENIATPSSTAWEIVCFSLALAEKIKIERRQKEKAQHQAIENLKISDRIKRQIFANTSHELRTPLNGILGFLDLIKRGHYGRIEKGVLVQLSKIQSLASSLKTQVNTILELAKSGEKRLSSNPSKILLNEIIEELRIIAEGLHLSNTNSELSITKSWRTEEDPILISDREKMFIIIRNLLANAFKFKDPSRKNSVSVNFSLNKDGMLSISISDTGIGIHEKDQEKIFEEFFQVDGEGRRRYEGSGLGLSIVRRYLDLIGGQVTVQSRIEVGSVFNLCIPSMSDIGDNISKLEEGAKMPELDAQQIISDKEVGEDDFAQISDLEDQKKARILPAAADDLPMKILVVDDHKYNCEVIRDILHAEGYQVDVAMGGNESIEKLRTFHPDLVLLDLMMPNCSGEDVIKYMKSDRELGNIPVVFVTARGSEEDIIVGLRMGADDYLTKPIISEELKLRVGNILSRIMYTKTQSEKLTIIKDISVAQEVHESYGNILLKIPQITVAEHYCPAETAGGDWRSIFYDENMKIMDVFICDVTGHGIASALYTVAAGSAIKNSVIILNDKGDVRCPIERVERIAKYLNASIVETSRKLGKMMSMAIISIDLENGRGAYLNAGHHFCLIGGNSPFKPIAVSGDLIGMEINPQFESTEFEFGEGDTLFLYTDGLIENKRGNGKTLRSHHLRKILNDCVDPENIKKGILDAIDKLWGQAPCEDDYTFLAIQKTASASNVSSEPQGSAVQSSGVDTDGRGTAA
ncbi:MAG: SpoIIE family protein phosphatase [Oligoflexales bacterium]|nr:SpoIIE family protein phosphatase [Oligoflexales bacterium]